MKTILRLEEQDDGGVATIREKEQFLHCLNLLFMLALGYDATLLSELGEPYRTMVSTSSCLGLRRCELVGLQWKDVDFENLTVHIQRSVNEGQVHETKTLASEGTLPLDPELAEALLAHKRRSTYVADLDYVSAADSGKPRWPDSMLADHLKPAAARANN